MANLQELYVNALEVQIAAIIVCLAACRQYVMVSLPSHHCLLLSRNKIVLSLGLKQSSMA
jgi:hypothetical protein